MFKVFNQRLAGFLMLYDEIKKIFGSVKLK